MLSEFHFLRPLWLFALLALPLAWFAWRQSRSEAGAWRAMVDAHLLPHLLERSAERSSRSGVWLGASIWIVASIALAGPAWERIELPLYRNDAARVIAIELAPTMLAADVKPTRLERARFKINDILGASRDMQTALIGYGGDAFVAAPLTDDVNTVRNLVGALDPSVMPVAGNATDRAISEALNLVEQAGLKRGELVILADSVNSKALYKARDAHSKGLTISVLGVGTTTGAPVPLPQGGFLQDGSGNIVLPKLDESRLRALAEAGGGRYATLTSDRSDIEALLSLDASAKGAAEAQGSRAISDRYRDRGPWLLLGLLPLALLAFRRGWLMILPMGLLASAPDAQAFSFTDLWLRPDQQAARALKEGDAARALELAEDPALRGSAAYRNGNFDAANQAWSGAQGADADYNNGNALAKLGKYEEALAAYERALKSDPEMEDALANKRAVEEWLERQQKQQSQSNSGENKDNNESQSNENSDSQASDSGQQDPQNQDSQDDSQQSESDAESKEQPQKSEDESASEQNQSQQDGEEKSPEQPPRSAEEQAQQDAEREQQQQELSKTIDEALDEKSDQQTEQQPVPTPAEESAREQQQAMQQWLQRVPDDPGGLLRRKFQLEYERRKRGGGGG
jgi:Ca-activated chloride channel family protein